MPTRACTALIADDQSVIRAGLSTMLAEIGIQVLGRAEKAEKLLELVRKEKPGLLTLELRLGIGLVREILEVHPTCRILVYTRMNGQLHADQALRDGAIGYLMKGGTALEVRKALQSVARGDQFVGAHLGDSPDAQAELGFS